LYSSLIFKIKIKQKHCFFSFIFVRFYRICLVTFKTPFFT
jgi:hypothetical protein